MNSQIAIAAEGQSRVVEEMNEGIANIANVTDHTTVEAQAAVQTTDEIRTAMSELAGHVARLKLTRTGQA